ncbi:MAG: AAA family ATPase [Methanomassiliicoccales archaeon]|nr:AAA family ATPase [Methanomassiliicoccales archaeon]
MRTLPQPGVQSKIFKDASKLSFDFVPEKLVHRERQLEKLWMLFRPLLDSGTSQTAFLIGSVGTGKTALSKRFCLDLVQAAQERKRAVDFIVVNCRQRNTETSVLLRLVSHFDEGYPDRGFSSAEMLSSLRKHLDKRRLHMVIVLDEADVLLKKGAGDLIYHLSRFDEEKVGGRASVSLILVSQKNVLDMLDPASLSTFRRANAITFDKYTTEELKDIIDSRIQLAFFSNVVRGDAVDLMADISSDWGDARFAIELLEKSGMLAEEEGIDAISPEHVRAAKALTYSVVTESRIESLDVQRRLVLLAITRSLKDQAYVTTGEVERSYAVTAEEYGQRARGHTQFWAYMQDISNEGLIDTKVSSDVAGGRTTYISLPDIPTKVLRQKLEEMLKSSQAI